MLPSDDSPESSLTIPSDDNNSSSQTKKEWDRDWLIKLVRKHQRPTASNPSGTVIDDPRLKSKSKILATAPMIEQSDTAFRILTRRYGANLCFTPMIHAHTFLTKKGYQDKMFRLLDTNNNNNNNNNSQAQQHDTNIDRPLIAQIAGNHKNVLLQAALLLAPHVDAIDINLGCPTLTAKRGRYGAFLLHSGDYVVDIIQHLARHLIIKNENEEETSCCPLTVKVRLLSSSSSSYDDNINLEKSIQFYERLVNAGASMLTIHGRTRDEIGPRTGTANWDAIRQVVQRLGHRVPIIANGNIANYEDVIQCLEYTGADGVMSSEAILEYPPLVFQPSKRSIIIPPIENVEDDEDEANNVAASRQLRPGPGRLQIAYEYLDLCRTYPPDQGNGGTGMQCMCMHIDTFLFADWIDGRDDELRKTMRNAKRIEDLYAILKQVEMRRQEKEQQTGNPHKIEEETLCWYYRHRQSTSDQK